MLYKARTVSVYVHRLGNKQIVTYLSISNKNKLKSTIKSNYNFKQIKKHNEQKQFLKINGSLMSRLETGKTYLITRIQFFECIGFNPKLITIITLFQITLACHFSGCPDDSCDLIDDPKNDIHEGAECVALGLNGHVRHWPGQVGLLKVDTSEVHEPRLGHLVSEAGGKHQTAIIVSSEDYFLMKGEGNIAHAPSVLLPAEAGREGEAVRVSCLKLRPGGAGTGGLGAQARPCRVISGATKIKTRHQHKASVRPVPGQCDIITQNHTESNYLESAGVCFEGDMMRVTSGESGKGVHTTKKSLEVRATYECLTVQETELGIHSIPEELTVSSIQSNFNWVKPLPSKKCHASGENGNSFRKSYINWT